MSETEKEKKKRLPRLVVDAQLIAEVKKLGGLGLTFTQIGYYYSHNPDQWREKVKKYPDLEVAMRQGKAHKIKLASSKLWDLVEKGNIAAITFFLKTQGGWREASPIVNDDEKSSKPLYPAITLTVNDPVEAAKIYQQIMIGS